MRDDAAEFCKSCSFRLFGPGAGLHTVISIDVLAKQRDFADAADQQGRTLRATISERREYSPRVYGTTQNVQNLSQPS